MCPEKFTQPSLENSSLLEIKKKALQIEKMNTKIENAPSGEKRRAEIYKIDELNKKLNWLEESTGIPEEHIMKEYTKLTEELAVKGAEEIFKEVESFISIEESALIKKDLNSEKYTKFLEIIKIHIPKRLLLATACVLTFSTSAWAFDSNLIQLASISTESYHVSQSQNSQKYNTDNTTLLEKTNEIISTADQRAQESIKNIDGFIKKLAQKRVIDEIANHSQEIINYINDNTTKLPQLAKQSMELFAIYSDAIIEVDKLENTEASIKIRQIIQDKISLIATKNYSKIKKEML